MRQELGYRRRPTRGVYLRRRLAVAAVLALLAVSLLALLAPDSGATPSAEPETIVVVGEGDTVLDTIRPYVPEGEDPRLYAASVLADSGLDARAVRPGAVLRLPRP